jgi:hypothetical protein
MTQELEMVGTPLHSERSKDYPLTSGTVKSDGAESSTGLMLRWFQAQNLVQELWIS